MKSVFDQNFQYTRSVDTDIRKTFARVRRKMREAQESQALVQAQATITASSSTPAKPGTKTALPA